MDFFATLFTTNAPEGETATSIPIDADGGLPPGDNGGGCTVA
jgi:hypothetical protein